MAAKLHRSIQDPKRFALLVDDYIKQCLQKDDNGKDTLISMVGLALHLGCDKDSILRWVDVYKEPSGHDPDCLIYGAIKRAKHASEHQLQQDCYQNRNAMSLALAKCMFGYVEAQHIKHDVQGNVAISVATGVPSATDGTKA